ncbi:hypothetical protein, partial [Lentibacter algarum]|uniref:hypothetical protein n=1 Tax=Lentibacter algarum TaxID=576131 RepID=UPI0023573E61
ALNVVQNSLDNRAKSAGSLCADAGVILRKAEAGKRVLEKQKMPHCTQGAAACCLAQTDIGDDT